VALLEVGYSVVVRGYPAHYEWMASLVGKRATVEEVVQVRKKESIEEEATLVRLDFWSDAPVWLSSSFVSEASAELPEVDEDG
jgi:hypothetical protein